MSENQDLYKIKCLRLIEEKLGWGNGAEWSNADFQKLSDLIYESTNTLLSPSTLKRVWGRVNYQNKPATATLNTLVKFIGYESWRAFVTVQQNGKAKQIVESAPTVKSIAKRKPAFIWILSISVLLFLALSILFRATKKEIPSSRTLDTDRFTFSSKAITRSIPNSVIFTYDATEAPLDSVFIQQNWDANRRIQVPKEGHTHTSIYYEPGFYAAKLVIGKQIVKEHPLLIPSDGWLATIDRSPIPIYFKKESFLTKDRLELSRALIEKNKVSLMAQIPVVKYFNVGNFDPVPISDFSFTAQVKNEFQEGSGACQFSYITLITNSMPISIPLSVKGCISELSLMTVDQIVSGKKTDLSAFGVDFADWVNVRCKGDGKTLRFYVNNKLAYETPLHAGEVKIVGMAYVFMGTGSVKAIRLENAKRIAYQAF